MAQEHWGVLKGWLESHGPFFWQLLLQSGWMGLIGAMLALLPAILCIAFLYRRHLLKRQPRFWNLAIKLVYPLVVACWLLAGSMTGALFAVQRTLHDVIDHQLQPEITAQMPALRAQLAARLVPLGDKMINIRDMVRPMVKDCLYTPQSDSWYEQGKAWIINTLVMKVGAQALNQAFYQAIHHLPEIAAIAGMSDHSEMLEVPAKSLANFLTETGQKVDFTKIDRSIPEVFTKAVRKQVDSMFTSVYVGLALNLLLVALLIGLEMLVYFRWYIPRQRLRQSASEMLENKNHECD